MKKWMLVFAMVGLLLSVGCSAKGDSPATSTQKPVLNNTETPTEEVVLGSAWAPTEEFQAVQWVGEVPAEFREVVEKDLFYEGVAFEDCVLTAEETLIDEENHLASWQVRKLDPYGKELASYALSTDDAYGVLSLTSTEDGGFLFVLGFSDFAYGRDSWASDKGFASRVIKCDSQGNLQFDTAFEGVEGSALKVCFEENGRFYFFGTREDPATKRRGTYSLTDVYMAIVAQDGTILKTGTIAGSDFDSLDAAEVCDEGFLLSISAQSSDGDFVGSTKAPYAEDWVFTVDAELEIVAKERKEGRSFFDERIGMRDGAPVYNSDPMFAGFDAGTPNVFLDYGDFYLIVSSNRTGVYENTPMAISSIWYYYETVYSAYSPYGELIFRSSVDATPNYGPW